ncbi:MAG: PEGA domain-containing protein [Methanoregula sp.]
MDIIVPTTTPTLQPVRVIVIPVTMTTTNPIGAVSITSIPSGATVIIDGSVQGSTPYTIRTLTTGSHLLLLQLGGYQDYSTTFTITSGTLNQQTYTLVPVTTTTTTASGISVIAATATTTAPVTTVTTTSPGITVVTATTTTPVTVSPTSNVSVPFGFPRPVMITPITITVGNHTKSPRLTTLSPYYSAQLSGPGTTSTGVWQAANIATMPTSYIEVDSLNVYLLGSHVMSGAEMALDPIWGDEDSVPIATTDKFFNNTNFRWISAENGMTGFYQVSRYPFDSNASLWQNQYVPGLVSSGPVKDIHVDSDGFHYFSLNFAPIGNHNPSDPPFYTGIAQLDPTVPGEGTPMGMVRIPLIGVGIYTKNVHAGPLSFPFPAGFTMIPAGEFTESDLGNPNANMLLSTPEFSTSHAASFAENAILSLPQTYYVRVVPIHSDGTAGIPTLPVTVTVVRPEPCPPNPPSNTENDVVVKPPSATVESFYMTSFVPDWIHTDQNGKLVARAHFVTVSPPPYCAETSGESVSLGISNAQLCSMYGGNETGYHFYADPAASHWYDTVWDIIKGLFSAWGQVINAASAAWNDIQNVVVEIAAYAVQGLTFGAFNCNSSPACMAVLRTGLSIAESSLGIPPTVPNVADLENMGADYMAKVAADELGAGGVLDTAQTVYNGMPDSVQSDIKNNAGQVGSGLADSLASQTGSAAASAAGGSFYIPDPLYYEAHPATVIVRVTNPNNIASDPVTMTIKDSTGLYKSTSKYVPTLAPHDSTVIPIVLEEDYSTVYTSACNADAYTSTCDDGTCVPCYWNLWYFAVIQSSKNGGDTFSATFSTMKDGFYTDLTPSSSGTVLSSSNIMNFDEQGKSCGSYNAKTVLTYPSGWQMQANALKQDLWSLTWLKYTFTEGDHGRLISG